MSDEATAALPSHPPPQTGPGTVLGGRYQLETSLGHGGMAQVFRARDTTLRRTVAVKVFDHAALPDEDIRRAAEVHLLASLSHPGLVTLFDAGRSEGTGGDSFAYLVMELVDGPTLADRLGAGALPPGEVGELGAQLAGALGYVHARGVVHRDVKPANILLSAPGHAMRAHVSAKLTDFGVARLLDSTRLTVHGATLGTANYLSPEQAMGAEVTTASDVYSFGLVLLECLTGVVAYPGHGVEAAVVRLTRAPDIPDQLGPAWVGLLRAMTATDPAERPVAGTVATALRSLAARPPATPNAPTQFLGAATPSTTVAVPRPGRPAPRGRRPGSRRRVWLALLAVLAAAVTGAIILTVRSGNSATDLGPRPAYPLVGGTIGSHLRQLQDAVG